MEAMCSWMNELTIKKSDITCNRILFSLTKEGSSDTHYNRNEPWRHYVEWNKSVRKGQILYESIYMRYFEDSKCTDT